ncbi:MAG: RluA family pseudouridine synthase [Cyclobacteriaceae bacterium]|jgi:RluA family pseudouridine synthase|nr:RluA family pseudouridine synthase [Cyclobacteriaceae bacterium]
MHPSHSLAFSILYEDDSILVVNKPAGLMVEPDRNGHPNLLQQVKRYLKNDSLKEEVYAQHIHRLDRPVSGIVLFAKQRAVLKNLSEQFAERKVKKFYQALTVQEPALKTGTLEHWHRKEKKKAMLFKTQESYTEKAQLNYEITKDGNLFLWKIQLHTGKYHQIRAQLASVDCPILGDSLYGSQEPYHENAIALDASELIFNHPLTNEKLQMISGNHLKLKL